MRRFRMATRRVYQLALSEVTVPSSLSLQPIGEIAGHGEFPVELLSEMKLAAAVAMRWAAAEVVLELEQFWLPIARVYWAGYRPIAVKDDWLIVA